MRALVTGAAGFVGSHLVRHLQALGATVHGISRGGPGGLQGDILNGEFVGQVLQTLQPTHIFHLAGTTASAGGGWAAAYLNNVQGTASLLEAVAAAGQKPRIVIVGSSAVYGRPASLPVRETDPVMPLTHYGVSKAAQELVALRFRLCCDMDIVTARTFNLIGPGQPAGLVASDIAGQIVAAERGGEPLLQIGNLSPQRDYLDVRDAVRAYALLARAELTDDVFNVCSGEARPVAHCVEVLTACSTVPLQIKVSPGLLRPLDIAFQVGSAERLRHATGWQPSISFDHSLRDLLDHWRGFASMVRISGA